MSAELLTKLTLCLCGLCGHAKIVVDYKDTKLG